MERRLSVVLITFDSARHLPRCLQSIQEQAGVDLELIVIDNASSDDSAAIVEGVAPSARLIRNAANVGFAAAVNQAIRLANAPFILLANPDVRFERDFARTILEFMAAHAEVGMASGKLRRGVGEEIEPTSLIDSLGILMTRSGRHFDAKNGEEDDAPNDPFEVFGVTGAAMMLRRDFIQDISLDGELFDERFFAYREDADLSWRAQLRGWQAFIVPAAVAYHVRRVTPEVRASLPPEINLHSVKNRFLLRANNEGLYLALRNAPFELFRDLLVIAGVVLKERTSLPALRWLWQHRFEIVERRRRVQERRRVSDRQLARWFR